MAAARPTNPINPGAAISRAATLALAAAVLLVPLLACVPEGVGALVAEAQVLSPTLVSAIVKADD
jgi:hypothetical protein